MMHRGTVTLEELKLFCRICRALQDEPGCSQHQLKERLGMHVSRISSLIKKFDQFSGDGSPVVRRQERRGANTLTTEGARLYDIAVRVLREYDRLGAKAEATVIRVKTTNAILVNLLPDVITEYLRQRLGQVKLELTEGDHDDILNDLRAGRIDFGVGPELPMSQRANVEFHQFRFDVPMVVVAHPSHPLARKILAGHQAKMTLNDLRSQLIYVLHSGLQPNAFELVSPDYSAGGERISVQTYAAILAFARTGVGVGIVPGFHWMLDDMLKQGAIVYAPMPEMPRVRICAYLGVGGRGQLSKPANEFLAAIEGHIEQFSTLPKWRVTPLVNLPKTLRGYRFVYHISCDDLGSAAPEWRKGEISFKQMKSVVWGEAIDYVPGGSRAAYRFKGRLEKRLLSLDADSIKGPVDRYVAVFNTVGERQTLVGTWTGTGSDDRPLSAPTVLSKVPLEVPDLRKITKAAMLRFIQGADVGFGLDDQSGLGRLK